MVKANCLRVAGGMLIFLLCFVLLSPPGLGAEAEGEGPELTLWDVLEKARKRDHDVRKSALERDKAREEKHQAADALRDSYVHMTPEYEDDHRRAVMAELNYQMKSGEEEAARSSLAVEVVEKYGRALDAERKVELARQELAAEEWDYKEARARQRNGMLSLTELEQAGSFLEQKRSELAQAEQALEKAYVELNALMGRSPQRRPKLVTELPYRPLEIGSMDAEVSRAVDSSEDLYALNRYVQIQRQELRLYFIDRDLQEYEVELAELQEAEAKSEIKKQVRRFYRDILSLEEKVASAEKSVKRAEQASHGAEVRCEAGMAPKGELIRAEADLAGAREGLARLQHAHVQATATYRNLTGRTIVPAEDDL